ncbi:hypothetical protein TrLO_g2442 [Triparma laevis f. longispina]|uniref:Uncharacterized protein n=1 Tax=Triparma laevis f. longispina TaxID=1714387 RepID=A0A9W7FLW3_9STRA|nr:hypothetical protein TrLO_g2442 [Triparma laevis f. longispina]
MEVLSSWAAENISEKHRDKDAERSKANPKPKPKPKPPPPRPNPVVIEERFGPTVHRGISVAGVTQASPPDVSRSIAPLKVSGTPISRVSGAHPQYAAARGIKKEDKSREQRTQRKQDTSEAEPAAQHTPSEIGTDVYEDEEHKVKTRSYSSPQGEKATLQQRSGAVQGRVVRKPNSIRHSIKSTKAGAIGVVRVNPGVVKGRGKEGGEEEGEETGQDQLHRGEAEKVPLHAPAPGIDIEFHDDQTSHGQCVTTPHTSPRQGTARRIETGHVGNLSTPFAGYGKPMQARAQAKPKPKPRPKGPPQAPVQGEMVKVESRERLFSREVAPPVEKVKEERGAPELPSVQEAEYEKPPPPGRKASLQFGLPPGGGGEGGLEEYEEYEYPPQEGGRVKAEVTRRISATMSDSEQVISYDGDSPVADTRTVVATSRPVVKGKGKKKQGVEGGTGRAGGVEGEGDQSQNVGEKELLEEVLAPQFRAYKGVEKKPQRLNVQAPAKVATRGGLPKGSGGGGGGRKEGGRKPIKKLEIIKGLRPSSKSFARNLGRNRPEFDVERELEGGGEEEVEEEPVLGLKKYKVNRSQTKGGRKVDGGTGEDLKPSFKPIALNTRAKEVMRKPQLMSYHRPGKVNSGWASNRQTSSRRSPKGREGGKGREDEDEEEPESPSFIRKFSTSKSTRDDDDVKPELVDYRHLNRAHSEFGGGKEDMEDGSTSEEEEVGEEEEDDVEKLRRGRWAGGGGQSPKEGYLKKRTILLAEKEVHMHHHVPSEEVKSPVMGKQRRHIFEHVNEIQFDKGNERKSSRRTKLSIPEFEIKKMLRVNKTHVDLNNSDSSG